MHLEHVRIKGYRSIRDCEVSLKPGLNIMIGYNGAGKSNVIHAIYAALKNKVEEMAFDSFEFKAGGDSYSIEKSKISLEEFNLKEDSYTFAKNKEKFNSARKFGVKFNPAYSRLIPYNIPNDKLDEDLNSPIDFSVKSKPDFDIHNDYLPPLIWFRYWLLIFLSQDETLAKLTSNISRDKIIILLRLENYFIETLKEIVNLDTVTIDQHSIESIHLDLEQKEFSIEKFKYDFYVDGKRLNYSNLSDGTKRVFYSLATLLSPLGLVLRDGMEDKSILSFSYDHDEKNKDIFKLLLWEEPEIGLHPHQLFKLMNIVKERSRYRQILLTTHSPIVLNCLEPDELDRIVICDYVKGEGTQLRKLTQAEVEKAQSYMENVGYLSDYWMHSDLQQWKSNQ